MDERSARTMFRQLAEQHYEETTVDVDQAIRGGRRRRRRRTLALVAGAAALVIGGVGILTAPMLRDDPKAMQPAGQPLVAVDGADLDVRMQRVQVGWVPDGVVGTTTFSNRVYQSVAFLRSEKADGGGGGPLVGYGLASVWLVKSSSPLTFTDSALPSEPGPDLHGAGSTWVVIKDGPAPGGTLTWTPSPGLRAIVVAGSKATAAAIAQSVRIDRVTPVVLPFTLPRPRDLEVSGVATTRYANGHFSGAVTFRRAGDTAQFPSELTFWLARDDRSQRDGVPTTTVHGRPARLSDGPPENGVNVWLHLDDGVIAGSRDAAQNGRYMRNRSQVIAMVESLRPVADPGDFSSWTPDYLR